MEKCGNKLKNVKNAHGFLVDMQNMSEVYDSHVKNEIRIAGSKFTNKN